MPSLSRYDMSNVNIPKIIGAINKPSYKTDEDFGPPVVNDPNAKPVPTEPPPTTTTTPPPTTTTNSNIPDWLKPFLGNNGTNQLPPAAIAAYLAQAYNHYNDSDRYTTMAERYAGQLDPFKDQRGQYQNQLALLMSNPEEALKNDPFLQGQIRLATGPAMSKMRAMGYGNSGNILSELTKLSGDVTSKYIGDLRKDLGNFSGAQFGPGAAASILQAGMNGDINSRNSALGDIGALIGNLWRTDGNGKPTTTTPTIPDVNSFIDIFKKNGGKWTDSLLQTALSLFKTPQGGLDIQAMQNAGLSANDILYITTHGNDTGTPYPTQPPDVPPPDEPPPVDIPPPSDPEPNPYEGDPFLDLGGGGGDKVYKNFYNSLYGQ